MAAEQFAKAFLFLAPVLLLRFPLRLVHLTCAANRQRMRWNVICKARCSADVCAISERDRRHERAVASNKDSVPDRCHELISAVVVARDGASSDIAAFADHGVAQVREMVGLGAAP